MEVEEATTGNDCPGDNLHVRSPREIATPNLTDITIQHYKNMMMIERWSIEGSCQTSQPQKSRSEPRTPRIPSFIYMWEKYPIIYFSREHNSEMNHPPKFFIHKKDLKAHNIVWNVEEQGKEEQNNRLICKVFEQIHNHKQRRLLIEKEMTENKKRPEESEQNLEQMNKSQTAQHEEIAAQDDGRWQWIDEGPPPTLNQETSGAKFSNFGHSSHSPRSVSDARSGTENAECSKESFISFLKERDANRERTQRSVMSGDKSYEDIADMENAKMEVDQILHNKSLERQDTSGCLDQSEEAYCSPIDRMEFDDMIYRTSNIQHTANDVTEYTDKDVKSEDSKSVMAFRHRPVTLQSRQAGPLMINMQEAGVQTDWTLPSTDPFLFIATDQCELPEGGEDRVRLNSETDTDGNEEDQRLLKKSPKQNEQSNQTAGFPDGVLAGLVAETMQTADADHFDLEAFINGHEDNHQGNDSNSVPTTPKTSTTPKKESSAVESVLFTPSPQK